MIIVPAPFFDPKDYEELAQEISSQGIVVVIPQMPNGGHFYNRGYQYDYDCTPEIKRVLSMVEGTKNIILAGHSWGGNVIQKFVVA